MKDDEEIANALGITVNNLRVQRTHARNRITEEDALLGWLLTSLMDKPTYREENKAHAAFDALMVSQTPRVHIKEIDDASA
jgi:hypothetical protein